MTEAEWLAATDTATLWESDYLWKRKPKQKARVSERQYRLFAVACSRRIWSLYPDDISRRAIEISEQYADGLASKRELEAVGQNFQNSQAPNDLSESHRWARGIAASHLWDASYRLASTVSSHCVSAIGQHPNGLEEKAHCDIIRDMFPTPVRPVALDPAWLTSSVLALARQMYDSRDFSPMPVLADALEDSGCAHADILTHCRGDGPHTRGCWVVDLLLGKE